MRNPTLGDLKLALRDLLGDRLAELRLTATGKLYEPRLRTKQQQIEAIPEAAGPLAPLAKELGETDVQHDGFGAATFYLCRAIAVHPTLPAALKQAAADVQQTFVPELDILRAPYSDEASAALDNRPELTRLKTELKSIAAPGGGTLHDWVKGFITSGDNIDKLLRQRATLLATGENAGATGPLRGATIGVLGRFRDALGDEIRDDGGKIPADHDARLFAYIDKLNDDRALRARGAAAAEPAAPAEEPAVADPAPPKK